MGRLLGSHSDSNELDRPDLNKCPDCGCFFAQDNCPLCGKTCPEEMRAGNRRPVKQKKQRAGGSNRVMFVEWYHSWWFIILMMFLFPIAGIILLVTSPHKRSLKIGFVVLALAYTVLSTVGIGSIVNAITGIWDKPVDTSLDRTEYIAVCEQLSAEDYYRSAKAYEDKYICLTLRVTAKAISDYNSDDTYYICRAEDGGEFEIIIRDCILDGGTNLIAGDIVTVYGEGDEEKTLYDAAYNQYTAPCVNVAYVEVSK